MSCSCITFWEE